MVRDPAGESSTVEEVLAALYDDDCRAIVRNLEEPMTASEISDACNVPLSTTYRKLETMVEATLLEELTEIRSDGHHTTRYRLDFDQVTVSVDDDRRLAVAVSRPARTPDERLADMWSEVSREA
ncbi:transcriptional regulator [Saliphagus sp. LR7]|uniref:transcriptional regulator n=1 Tax=Saliphagus sp. LR7 TaxID=2282654 RepID=UPI000DF74FB0|nr:transcriptional regulator [Saliphagus sp. LR7]